MKILFITNGKDWSGGLVQLNMLMRSLEKSGHEIGLILNPESVLKKALKDTGISLFPVKMRQEYDIFSVLQIIKIIDYFQPDIVDTQRGKAHTLALISALFKTRPALIMTRRVAFKVKRNPLSWLKYNSNRIDRHIAISTGVARELKKGGVFSKRISIIRDAVDSDKFDKGKISQSKAKAMLDIDSKTVLVLCIANASTFKGQMDLLEAWSTLEYKYPRALLVLAGRDTDGKWLNDAVLSKGIKQIKLLGWRDDIPLLLSAGDIFVLPSREEGLGTALLEAGYMGLPLIGTRVGGIPEIIEHGKNGFLVESKDADQLAKAIESLLTDERMRKVMGHNGELGIKKRVRPDNVAKRVLGAYKKAVLRRKARIKD